MEPSKMNAAQVYVESLSSLGSRRTVKGRLNSIAKLLIGVADAYAVDWGTMTYAQSAKIRGYVTQNFAAKTVNTMLSAYRGVLKTAWRLGQLDGDAYQRAADVRNVPKIASDAGRYIEPDEVIKLFQVCQQDETPFGVRDLAMLHVLRNGGLRRTELIQLDVRDFDAEDRSVFIRNGKGRKRRRVFLPSITVRAVQAWLDLYKPGDERMPLFSRISMGMNILGRRISEQSVYLMVHKRAEQAGIPSISTHDFRRTYISGLFDKGVDISTISQLVGHNAPEDTAVYDRRKDDPKRRAADLLDDGGEL